MDDNVIERNKLRVIRFPTTQTTIDALRDGILKNIRFSSPPTYNSKIRTPGKMTMSETGIVLKIEIGPQDMKSEAEIIDSMIHEELEARIAKRAFRSLPRWAYYFDERNQAVRHLYINAVIARFFKRKGIAR